MEILQKQNEEIKRAVEVMLQEIEKQKELNLQHEQEIETLLKFNERLLGIIENELNNKKDNCSLQPISERSERQSDLVVPTIHSLIKVRRFGGGGPAGGAKSQKGYDASNSLISPRTKPPVGLFDIEAAKSQINHSYSVQNSDNQKVNNGFKKASLVDSIEVSDNLRTEISNEIKEIKKFKDEGTKFYDQKIGQIRALSTKLKSCTPLQHLNKISEKLTLTPATSNLIKKTIKGVIER